MSEMPSSDVTYREAEEAVLGAVLLRGHLAPQVVTLLRPEDFEPAAHQLLFETLVTMADVGAPIEFDSVVTELRRTGRLNRCGGEAQLATLQSHGAVSEWKHYADVVKDAAAVRRLRDVLASRIQDAQPGSGKGFQAILDEVHADLNDMGESSEGDGLRHANEVFSLATDAIEEAARRKGSIIGVPTGIKDLDSATNGFMAGQMIVVAGRPGMGKSTLGLDFARHVALDQGMPVALFSLEMTSVEIMMRLMSASGRVDLGHLRSGSTTDQEWEQIQAIYPSIAAGNLFIDETPQVTMADIKVKSRRLAKKHGLALIVIDYLQLMGSSKTYLSREQEVSAASRQIKLLAKELGVPIVVMAQLNRASEHRSSGKPMLSDLRESGAIEQDADIVILIHQEDKTSEESTRSPGEADLIIAKSRNGPTATIPVLFQGHYSRFRDASKLTPPPAQPWDEQP